MNWVPVPNNHDGDGYTALASQKNGAAMLGGWLVILQVASRCDPRGTLLRSCKLPHNSESIARITRLPSDVIESTLCFCSSVIHWIDVEDFTTITHECAVIPQEGAVIPQEGALKGMEGNGKKEHTIVRYHPDTKRALDWLVEKSGRQFRETESNLKFISARLMEPGVTLDGVKKMIERQCGRWIGTDQAEYLRPETLFNKTKFDAYYSARDLPSQTLRKGREFDPRNIL